MIIDISVAIIALAFLALAIYLIRVCISLRQTLAQVTETLHEVRKQIHENQENAKTIVEKTGLISVNLLEKMEALDSIFKTISNIGNYCKCKSDHLTQEAIALAKFEEQTHRQWSSFNEKEIPGLAKIADTVELIWAGIKLWNRLKKGR